ncbi:hypothetical protein E0Z10_g1358 [Xylaria hypoxylon]|uniref:Zn(2)-C6 fungal-type domain-containing protein n=1 Tax=Xylaria hypoxylon TaxID=37992 RepID=A0A4Z0YTX0_9PEZI|nr:hypothetical protein E0Z10_g1358 [Xylaria hypoxylon]
MVGVPGKYKGCNTCRVRRVKCDNTRPLCKKCTDYGRECGGYERETVFIIGTQDDKGRVGSHPPRNIQQSRAVQSEASTQHATGLEFVAAEPLQPAWHETVLLKSGPNSQLIRFVAQHADLDSAINHSSSSSEAHEVSLSLLDSQPLDVTPTFRKEDFNLKSVCFVSLPEASDDSTVGSDEGQNSSTMYAKEPPWNDMSTLSDAIRELGPGAYQAFPAHHFFARVYRPSAVWASLLNRQPTFLCNPEWTVVPWEHYPRTSLDDLLDVVVLLPSIYSRADHITLLKADADRQLKARELLDDCISIEAQFDIWHSVIQQGIRLPYWVDDPKSASIPFNEPLSFASPLLCLVHVYYWAVLIGFHQCIYALVEVIREPEKKRSSPRTAAGLPPGLDPRKYQPTETRELAALVCRSLDFALRTTAQPDLLVAPTWVVKDFYNRMNAIGSCELESLWVNDFVERREVRGREMSVWLEEKQWIGIRRFG